jgi:hypothetical protein
MAGVKTGRIDLVNGQGVIFPIRKNHQVDPLAV